MTENENDRILRIANQIVQLVKQSQKEKESEAMKDVNKQSRWEDRNDKKR